MLIDITDFFSRAEPCHYASNMLEGGPDVAERTWRAAINDAPDFPLLVTEQQQEAARYFFAGFGAWDEEELAEWDVDNLTALLIQFISADIREFEEIADGDWEEWRRLGEEGKVSSRLFGGSLAIDGRVYYYIGR